MSRLVSMTEMLQKAKEGKYAVGQFNINNLEWTQAVLTAAQEANSPIILGVSEVFSVAYGASSYRDAVAFGLIILLLFWRPQGLFGSKDKGGRP